MFDSILKLMIGDMEAKRGYKQMVKRVDALPEDYRFTFRKIYKYVYTTGAGIGSDGGITLFVDLIDFFEASAAEGKQVLDIIGKDVGAFVDELASATASHAEYLRETMNKNITEKFNKNGDSSWRTSSNK
ncbi:MAG: DUF1048 domain-containing protein [Clostridium sp.]|jgi:DNA-binding ferritin-like protein (Dps family)|nr:DUF1048 domain-containing protein [Clostridium sp.]